MPCISHGRIAAWASTSYQVDDLRTQIDSAVMSTTPTTGHSLFPAGVVIEVMLHRVLLRPYAPKVATAVRSARLLRARACSSSALPDGWEAITRRNGDVVYFNKELRKTVRHLPGVRSQMSDEAKPGSIEEKSEEPRTATVPHHESTGNEVYVPIDFDAAMSIEGHDSQVVHIELDPEQCLRAETGAMIYMTDGVSMETTTAGGLGEGVKRLMTGENFFVSRFTYHGSEKGKVALGTSFPSKIVHLRLSDFLGGSIICQKGAFLCGSDTVNIEMEFTKKFGVGFFGGEGFVLQRLTGNGDVLVRASGTLITRDLQPGEVLRISSGCLVAFEPSVHYDITMMKGAKNVLFGGEGLFVTTLTGPGKIYLQSLPFERVVGAMAARIPRNGPGGMMFPFMMGGGGDGDQGANAGAADEAAGAEPVVDSEESVGSGDTRDDWDANDSDIYGGGGDSDLGNDGTFDDLVDGGSEESSGGGIMGFFDSLFGNDKD